MEEDFIELTYDTDAEMYRFPNGELVKFTKEVQVKIDGEVGTHKLSYTRAWAGEPTAHPVPVLRIEGQKYRLDGVMEDGSHIDLEVVIGCVSPAKP